MPDRQLGSIAASTPAKPASNTADDLNLIAAEHLRRVRRGVSSSSQKEAKALFGDERRQEGLKEAIHTLMVVGVYVAGLMLITAFVVRMIHLVAPDQCIWLSAERIQKLDSILFSGALGAFVTKYFHQTLPAKKTDDQ